MCIPNMVSLITKKHILNRMRHNPLTCPYSNESADSSLDEFSLKSPVVSRVALMIGGPGQAVKPFTTNQLDPKIHDDPWKKLSSCFLNHSQYLSSIHMYIYIYLHWMIIPSNLYKSKTCQQKIIPHHHITPFHHLCRKSLWSFTPFNGSLHGLHRIPDSFGQWSVCWAPKVWQKATSPTYPPRVLTWSPSHPQHPVNKYMFIANVHDRWLVF